MNTDNLITPATYEAIGRLPLATREDEARVCKGGATFKRQELVRLNLRFIAGQVVGYHRIYRHVPISDLFGAACAAALGAADNFDPSKEFRFVGYAKRFVQRAMMDQRTFQDRQTRGNAVEVNIESCDENGVRYVDSLEDPGPSPEEQAFENIANASIHEAIDRLLTKRDGSAIRLYYGLTGEPRLTLQEIGIMTATDRRRVQECIHRALSILHKDPTVRAHARDLHITGADNAYECP